MSDILTLPTADLAFAGPPPTKWDREYAAFLRMLPNLLVGHRGRYVAVHDGAVVGAGPDKVAVAMAAYRQFGGVEILVRLVTDEPPRTVRIPSAHRPQEHN